MAGPAHLERLVHHVAAQVRRRRAEYYGLRGAFYGAVAGLLPVLVKGAVGPGALVLAAGLVVLGAAAGVVFGLALAAPRTDLARLADRGFGLEDRVATALEWAARPDRTPLVDALVEDAVSRVTELPSRSIVPRRFPPEARLLPIPLAVVVVLALSPPIPLPAGRLPGFSGEPEAEATRDQTGTLQSADQARTSEPAKPLPLTQRDFDRAGPAMVRAGEGPALFKDTALGERPDFSSFVKKGDDRLRLLDQPDGLPDLKSDFTRSDYRTMLQESRALASEARAEQVPPEKLRELLEKMEQMGKKEGTAVSDAAAKGLKALDRGQQDKAIDAMNRAVNAMRESDEQRKGALNLAGGRQGDSGKRSSESGESREPGDPDQEEPGGSKGKLPGKGPSTQPAGEATARLKARGVDTVIEGEHGKGQRDSLDTNMFGHAAKVPSRLTTGDAFDQYRRLMEDALAREEVPRDYQPQVKDYFRALSEK
jgi:hypothetical protein